jgi:hypothetical protein
MLIVRLELYGLLAVVCYRIDCTALYESRADGFEAIAQTHHAT